MFVKTPLDQSINTDLIFVFQVQLNSRHEGGEVYELNAFMENGTQIMVDVGTLGEMNESKRRLDALVKALSLNAPHEGEI